MITSSNTMQNIKEYTDLHRVVSLMMFHMKYFTTSTRDNIGLLQYYINFSFARNLKKSFNQFKFRQ